MNWLSQNWIWTALAIGVALYFFGGALRRRTSGHGGGPAGLPDRTGDGGHAGEGGRDEYNEQRDHRPAANAYEAAVDPVGGEAVRTSKALTSLYEGRIYYFSSKETRDRFEAAPQEYAHNAAGYPVRAAGAQEDRPRRRGGC